MPEKKKMGRPPKLGKSKTVSLQLRIAQETADKLQECSDKLKVSRTEVIENGIDLIHKEIKKQSFAARPSTNETLQSKTFPSMKFIISQIETSFKYTFQKGVFLMEREYDELLQMFSQLTNNEAEKVLAFIRIMQICGAEEAWRLCTQ